MTIWQRRATLPLYGPTVIEDIVHDGDTVRLLIDQDDGWRAEKWIRLSGVRAPERSEPGWPETRQFALNWLAIRYGHGRAVRLRRRWPFQVTREIDTKAEPDSRVSLGRWLGWVGDVDTGVSLNDEMNRYLARHPGWPAGRIARQRQEEVMGYASRIGAGGDYAAAIGLGPGAMLADLIRARAARLVEAETYVRDHPAWVRDAADPAVLRGRIAIWVQFGGARPWEDPAASPAPYPPAPTPGTATGDAP